jgi:AbrB family looped-hinge helix DNA binding protein
MERAFEGSVDAEGHIDIPSEVRLRHGLTSGTRVKVEERGKEVVLSPARSEEIEDISDLAGWMSPSNAVEELLRERALDTLRENAKFRP